MRQCRFSFCQVDAWKRPKTTAKTILTCQITFPNPSQILQILEEKVKFPNPQQNTSLKPTLLGHESVVRNDSANLIWQTLHRSDLTGEGGQMKSTLRQTSRYVMGDKCSRYVFNNMLDAHGLAVHDACHQGCFSLKIFKLQEQVLPPARVWLRCMVSLSMQRRCQQTAHDGTVFNKPCSLITYQCTCVQNPHIAVAIFPCIRHPQAAL